MSSAVAPARSIRDLLVRWLTKVSHVIVWLVLAALSFWAMAALYIDVRLSALKAPADDSLRAPPRRDFGKVQTAYSSRSAVFRMFLPGACLVAKPETDKSLEPGRRTWIGRHGSKLMEIG